MANSAEFVDSSFCITFECHCRQLSEQSGNKKLCDAVHA